MKASLLAALAALLLVPAAASAKTVAYGGKLANDDRELIVLKADKPAGKVKQIVMNSIVACPSGQEFAVRRALKVAGTKGKFTYDEIDYVFGTGDKGEYKGAILIKGTVKKTKITGTVSMNANVVDAAGTVQESCTTFDKFTAARKPGRIYSGATTDGDPVLLTLNKSRTKVTNVEVGWYSEDCTPAGWWQLSDHLTNFPLTKSKAFGDVFSYSPENSKLKFDYDISGRVSKSRATGAFGVTATETHDDGTTFSCRTGRRLFTATSG